MFATDQAPGVHYQTVDAGSAPASPLRTDVAAFVGIAERGPVDVPVPVESWQQFVSWFGGCTPSGYLAYAVRGFLQNGGRRCWVVRVASTDPLTGASTASTILADAVGPVWRVRASSPGVFGDQLGVAVREINPTQVHTTGHDPDGRWSAVPSLAGLTRAALVRASQSGSGQVAYRTVSAVDPGSGRVHWTHPEPGAGLPYDTRMLDFDPDRPILLETVEYRMLVTEKGSLLRVYDGLSLVAEHARYGPAVLAPVRRPASTVAAPEPIVIEELRGATSALTVLEVDPAVTRQLRGGRDGLAGLAVGDFVGEPVSIDDSDEVMVHKRRGLRAVEELDEVGLLVVPDIHIRPLEPNPTMPPPPCVPDPCLDEPRVKRGPTRTIPVEVPPVFGVHEVHRVQAEMVLQAETRRDRFALLDPPHDVALDPLAGIRGVLDWRSRFDTSYAALSYPWLKVSDPVGGPGSVRLVPATGHVAGVMAATDLDEGVHRAPANRRLDWALGPSVAVDDARHAVLNRAGVNVARSVGGRGLRLLGARTMSADPDWVFVNVRRLMSMIEKALGIALQWAVFEPNGFLTRARATMTVTFFLDALHEAGMLAGATAEGSFFVRCDLDNNPPEQRDLGQLLVEVGVAPSQPFEFVVLRVGRVRDSVEVRGASSALGRTGTSS